MTFFLFLNFPSSSKDNLPSTSSKNIKNYKIVEGLMRAITRCWRCAV